MKQGLWENRGVKTLVAFASILAIMASLLTLLFGLLFFDNLRHHTLLKFLTLASPLVAIAAMIPYQLKPGGRNACFVVLSVLWVVITSILWLSDSAKGIIH